MQRLDQPTKDIDLDRIKAAELGVEPVDAIKNIVSALNSSATFDKAFWIDERNGNHYYVGVTYPQYLIDDEHILDNITVSSATHDKPVPFRNFSKISESTNPVEINHYDLQREFNVYANVEGADIGSVSDEIQKRIDAMEFPAGYKVTFSGEIATMKSSFANLGLGLGLAVVLAFLINNDLIFSFLRWIHITYRTSRKTYGWMSLLLRKSISLSIFKMAHVCLDGLPGFPILRKRATCIFKTHHGSMKTTSMRIWIYTVSFL